MIRLSRTIALAIFALVAGIPALWADPNFTAMLAKIDELNNFPTDFSAVASIVSEKPGEDPNVIQAQMFRRDRDKKFLILILAPDVQRGQGYLEVDNNLWFYDPQSREFSHSSLKENFQSSDAKNSDFNRTSLAKDYTVTSWKEGTLGVYPVYILDLKGTNDEVTYPYMRLWIRKDLGIVLKSEDYSLSKRLMRSAYYPNYVKVGEQYIPSRMLFIDELDKGNKTQLTLRDPSVAALPDYIFTKPYLERVNR